MRVVAITLFVASCSFSGASVESDNPDANPTAPDANLPGPDGDVQPMCTPWPQQALQFDNCAVDDPLTAPTFESGVSVLNTDTGELIGPTANQTFAIIEIPQSSGPPIALFFFESLDIPAETTIRAEGDRALLFASDSVLTVGGTIDVGSYRNQGDLAAGVSYTTHCQGARDADGDNGGGGGGGLGTAGGTGGFGGGNAASGGDAGGVVTVNNRLLPGCAGGIGNDDNGNANMMSAGGLGGGVVELAARTRIDLSDTAIIAAGGMGGGASDGNGTGGGGGGSGGLIGLDSQLVNIDGNAMMLANGGGGGEGSGSSNDGVIGEDSPMDNQVANGGSGGSGSGGDGGDGGFNQSGPENGNNTTSNGGGAGGGGLGVIRCTGCP